MSVALCCKRLPFAINARFLQPSRNGYIVLLPEINPNVPESAALLKDNMPDFSNFTKDKCVAILGKALLEFEHGVRVIEQTIEKAGCSDVVKEIMEPIEKIKAPFDTSWGIAKTLYLAQSNKMPSKSYLPLHNRARQARAIKFSSKEIYETLKECDQTNLTEEEQRLVNKYLLEGRLSGLELNEKSQLLKEIRFSISDAQTVFTTKVKISSELFQHTIRDPSITRDMPDQLLRLLAENKDEPSRGPWKVTLEPQLLQMFLAYCPVRELRWNLWQASVHVSSQLIEHTELRTSTILEEIRYLRTEEAKLFGYKTYADLSMETKMAGSIENVVQTLGNMLQIAKPAADRELEDLQKFASKGGFNSNLQVWDIPYWERKQKQSLFGFKEEALTDYFPMDKVWDGLLALCEKLFEIKFVENKTVDRWHPDVRFFYIYEDPNKPVAGFYLDPYAREDKLSPKRRDAFVVNIRPAAKIHKKLPLSSLILQLDPPIYGKPSLLTLQDVHQLFKQFGAVLQQLLSTVTYTEVAGEYNVEWDAAEVIRYVFLHWLRDPVVLESISGHYATGEKLPALPWADIEKHFAGYRLCEELFKAHLDLEMFTSKEFWHDTMKRLWPAHFNLPHDKTNSMPCSFTEVAAGQWTAAYYSHLWARMVAADVYSAFTEPDTDVTIVGSRFRDTYLAFGGSCPAKEVFRRFRGRDVSSEAFLKHLGLH